MSITSNLSNDELKLISQFIGINWMEFHEFCLQNNKQPEDIHESILSSIKNNKKSVNK